MRASCIETGLEDSDGGRPRAVLGMNPDYGYVIGVDIGETRTRVELFDLTMTERAKAEYPLDRYRRARRGRGRQADRVRAERGARRQRDRPQDAILGVGIGVPGIIEQGPEVLVHGQTYGWDAVPLERLLRAHTDLPLRFDNGAKTMGQAELWFGAGQGRAERHRGPDGLWRGRVADLRRCHLSRSHLQRGRVRARHPHGRRPEVPLRVAGCLEAYAGAEAILERYGRPMAADDQELALAELIDAAATSPLRPPSWRRRHSTWASGSAT